MIKGCERRIIYIRDTGSAVFKEAYFILREDSPAMSRGDMVAEAERIIRERTRPTVNENAGAAKPDRKNFIRGFLAATGVFAAGILIIALIL